MAANLKMRDYRTRDSTSAGLSILANLLACALFSGCFLVPADGGVALQGEVVASDGRPLDRCKLSLHRDEPGGVVQERRISSQFDEGFLISPWAANYFVEVACPEVPSVFRSRSFHVSGRADEDPIDLGTIRLEAGGGRR